MDKPPKGAAALDANEEEIMSRIAAAEKYSTIAETYGVHKATLHRWLKNGGPDRAAAYVAAKEAAGHTYAERAIEILEDGMEPTSSAQAQIIKSRADWNMRLAGVMNREFSERQDVNVGVVFDLGQLHLDALRQRGSMHLHAPKPPPLVIEGKVEEPS